MIRILFLLAAFFFLQPAHAQQKEWTMLVFLNGNNNLDRFGDLNINQMEQFGSTDQINFVVQRASYRAQDTKRYYITKGTNDSRVESYVVETLPRVDMGDYKNLIEFVLWGMQRFPAKKYFVAVWNHGSGWHKVMFDGYDFYRTGDITNDISNDDFSGNKITTQELGYAINYIAYTTGQKIELYGSDACLMQMIEVANEMKQGAKYVVGSQELEPGEGWPYHYFIERWIQNPTINGGELGKIMVEEYGRYYQGQRGITLSVIDLQYFDHLIYNLGLLSNELLNVSDKQAVATAANASHRYSFTDYKDLQGFILNLNSSGLPINREVLKNLQTVLNHTVLKSVNSSDKAGSYGLSIWLPTQRGQYSMYKQQYSLLTFDKETNWSQFLPNIQR